MIKTTRTLIKTAYINVRTPFVFIHNQKILLSRNGNEYY